MSTIHIQTSVEQLLDSVAQLPPDELASLTEKIIALRASHAAPHVERDEAELLLQINRDMPSEIRHRYDELIHKRQAETLSDDEHAELIDLTQQFEQREAERVTALANLARLRQISLPDLMTVLGIEAPTYD
ncbi:MAG: STAS/SEC14 domain-containing protein [Anaerolineaceae bacterium]|nr:STAS/SEC14 domain-containing protein [Anaerolineaceae bacterium]